MLRAATTTHRRLAVLALAVFGLIVFYTHSRLDPVQQYTFNGIRPTDADLDESLGQAKQHDLPGSASEYANDFATDTVPGLAQEPGTSSNANKQPIALPPPTTNYADGEITPIKHVRFEDQQKFVKQLKNWNPFRIDGHWPSFDGYGNKDYDQNRWEAFDWELDYYLKNGIKYLSEKQLAPQPYLPYPEYNSAEWKKEWKGDFKACEGARGQDLDQDMNDVIYAWPSAPPGFPDPSVGSASLFGLDENVCFDSYHRYGAYGFGQNIARTPEGWVRPPPHQWATTRWGQLQDSCLQRNKERYAPQARAPMNLAPTRIEPDDVDQLVEFDAAQSRNNVSPKYQHRTALLIRTWEGYKYTENDLHAIRSLVTELSLLSGGEYQVFLFVNVKQHDADIYDDPQVYQEVLQRVVPEELRDISMLWTEKVVEEWYPHVGEWQVYWQQFMPLQWFSKTHPEFDYIWNWETDARYTGSHYQFLEKMVEFARNMPRKYLWERNSRFYFPAEHGNFASYLADTDAAIRNASLNGTTPVWGPQKFNSSQVIFGPDPPGPQEEDNFSWGAGEEADLITLQPIWDPHQTLWSYRYKIWNFIENKRPRFSQADPGDDAYFHPQFGKVPRRVFINTVARFSKKMLHAMHMENRAGRSMQAEMWPATVALQHGLKAVYAPHPIWLDRKWPSWFLDATFNADNGEAAKWGQRHDSPYNHDREAAYRGWSWYYASYFPRTLYRRWLGWRSKDILGDIGGFKYEASILTAPYQAYGHDGEKYGGKGRMCLPGMLLHPVKGVVDNDNVETEVRAAEQMDRENFLRIQDEIEAARASDGFYWDKQT